MRNLYELFKVEEDATPEQITQAYHRLLAKSESLPQTENLKEQIGRIKIAYGILSNPEKRKKYDLDFATQKAKKLLEELPIKEEENKPEEKTSNTNSTITDETKMKQTIAKQIDAIMEVCNDQTKQYEKQQKTIEKQQKKYLRQEQRNQKKQKQLKREMEIQAYGRYLEQQGYQVKYPWTWLRVKRLLLAIFVLLISGFIIWQIPFIRKQIMDLYQQNFLIKVFIDSIVSIFTGIIDSIKSIFQ